MLELSDKDFKAAIQKKKKMLQQSTTNFLETNGKKYKSLSKETEV